MATEGIKSRMTVILATVGAKSTAAGMRAVADLGIVDHGDAKGALTFGMGYGLAEACVRSGMTDEQAVAMFRQMLGKARPK